MSLLNMRVDFVQGVLKSLVSVWNVAEVAFDPVGLRGDIKFECFCAVVSDLGGFVRVSRGCKACDNEVDIRKLRGMPSLLAGA